MRLQVTGQKCLVIGGVSDQRSKKVFRVMPCVVYMIHPIFSLFLPHLVFSLIYRFFCFSGIIICCSKQNLEIWQIALTFCAAWYCRKPPQCHLITVHVTLPELASNIRHIHVEESGRTHKGVTILKKLQNTESTLL